MAGLFYNLGLLAGPGVRKGKWLWQSLTGDEADIITAEAEVGRDLAADMLREHPPEGDASAAGLVRQIGSELAGCVRNRLRTFTFTLVAAPTANAFALPGGHVFITRPLLDLIAADPHELAFILGHEMAHVIKQDPMQRIMTDASLSAAMRVAPAGRVAGPWLKNTARQMLQSAYSQDRELMADKLGARLAVAAGYDGAAGPRMLQRLAQISDQNDLPLAEYFSTHPPINLRVGELTEYLAAIRTPGKPGG